jgi:hypothetical protein
MIVILLSIQKKVRENLIEISKNLF